MAINHPNFGDLSPEVSLRILDFVSPDDLVPFAWTCKSFYHLSAKRLREHRKQYEEVVIDSTGYSRNFLQDACRNPRIWNYVKKLTYKMLSKGGEGAEDNVNYDRVDPTCLNIAESLLDSSPYMKYGDDLVTCGKEVIADSRKIPGDYIHDSWPGMFLALLLAYFPNLTSLDVEACQFYPVVTPKLQLYKSIVTTILRANKQNSDLRALQQLSMVFFQEIENSDWLTPLLFAPSLSTLDGNRIRLPAMDKQLVGEQPSPLDRVIVWDSEIHRPQFLSVLTNLRKLVYRFDPSDWDEHDFQDILAYLKRYFSGTLQELALSTNVPRRFLTNSSLRSFREFNKLAMLRFSGPWVFGLEENNDEIEVPRLVDILPPSIMVVGIDIAECPQTAAQFFEGLVGWKHERLPNLEYIVFRNNKDRPWDQKLVDHLKEIGASAGIKVEAKVACEGTFFDGNLGINSLLGMMIIKALSGSLREAHNDETEPSPTEVSNILHKLIHFFGVGNGISGQGG